VRLWLQAQHTGLERFRACGLALISVHPMQTYPTLDEALNRTTMAMGTALVQWQFIEHAMFQLYAHLFGQSDQRAINLIYHSMGLEAKIITITKLVKPRSANSDVVQRWDKISKDIFKQKKLRDKLAYWTVLSGQSKEADIYPSSRRK
jgi:hypothetical protein